jgi:type II secretory pathway predicted ATPase ExeA
MDYLSFYRLHEDPFRLTPDPHFFYPTREHHDALFSLEYVVEQKEGFSVILGAPGTGKTTVLRVFMEKWKGKADIALVMTPRLSPEEFLQAVLEDLGVHAPHENKNEMIKTFRDILVARSLSGRRIIIIVDEAQDLSDETLEELRLLSNLETEKEKLLQIVLVGQLQLARKLASEGLVQLQQRIGVKAALNPLPFAETREYLNYRLIKAGKGSVSFREDALRLIHKASGGIPRLINLVASRSLMAASIEGLHEVGKNHVEYARKHLCLGKAAQGGGMGRVFRDVPGGLVTCTLAGVIVILAISLVFAKVNGDERSGTPPKGLIANPEVLGSQIGKARTPQSGPGNRAGKAVFPRALVVFLKDGNLRKDPSIEAPVITWAKEGAVFERVDGAGTDGHGRWYRVRMADGGTAWVSSAVAKPGG